MSNRGKQKRIVDFPELLLSVLQDGNYFIMCLSLSVLSKNIFYVSNNFFHAIQVFFRQPSIFNLVKKFFLYAGHIELAPYHRRRNLFEEGCIRAKALRLV